MLTRIRLLRIYYCAVIVLLGLRDGQCAESEDKYVGAVKNLSVTLLQDAEHTNNVYKFLQLNVSWLPPDSIRQPSFYSIIITDVQTNRNLTNTSNITLPECPEVSITHVLQNTTYEKQRYILLPENMLAAVPDSYIHPSCSYKVTVIANPRKKNSTVKPAEILYTVPDCIGKKCSCINAKSTLPTPTINVTQRGNEMVLNWNVSSNVSTVRYYTISIGVPLFPTKKGLPVYNITKIENITADTTSFVWNMKLNDHYIELRNDYKVIVTAVNDYGCSGTDGTFIIHSTSPNVTETIGQSSQWLIYIVIMGACCIFFATFNYFILFHTSYCATYYKNNHRTQKISKCKTRWAETILQKHNVLYFLPESEAKEEQKGETDTLQVPFKSVKLIRELGNGHFGKVYLGHLDDANNTVVAVKMSQNVDSSIELDVRQQFLEEIEIMKKAGTHPHLVNLIGYCVQPNIPICIILEYMQGGDLLTYLHLKRKNYVKTHIAKTEHTLTYSSRSTSISKSVYINSSSIISNKESVIKQSILPTYLNISSDDWEKAKQNDKCQEENWLNEAELHQFLKFAIEIATGMEYLESKKIVHRDLAARNILLGADLTLKISDFGLSRSGVYVIKNNKNKTRHLPIRWMSPEALRDRSFTSKSDVWAFGVVLWEIGTFGSFPYSNVQDDRLLRYIVNEGGRLEQPDYVSSNIYDIMRSCWITEPESRPNFTQLLLELRNLINIFISERSASNPCYALSL